MCNLIVETVDSIEEFVQYRDPWNQLWNASNGYEPLSRSEGIELWYRQFASHETLSAVLVWDGQQLVGALPLVHSKKSRVGILAQPSNTWVNGGELLVHQDAAAEAVVAKIIEQLKSFSESILCFDEVRFESAAWTTFIEQIEAVGGQSGILRPDTVGLIEIGDDWDHYFKSLSGNHRSTVRRAEKKANKLGQLSLLRLNDLTADECRSWMTKALEIENRSWKRANGSSILESEGMADFFYNEAEFARQAGMLELWFLLLDDEPIAFEYCHRANDVCFSYKIGYDEAYKNLAPGKLLRKLQLETLHRDNPGSVLDTKGILCSAKAKWVSNAYSKGRLIAALDGRIPKLLLSCYLQARPIIQMLRNVDFNQPPSSMGATSPIG